MPFSLLRKLKRSNLVFVLFHSFSNKPFYWSSITRLAEMASLGKANCVSMAFYILDLFLEVRNGYLCTMTVAFWWFFCSDNSDFRNDAACLF